MPSLRWSHAVALRAVGTLLACSHLCTPTHAEPGHCSEGDRVTITAEIDKITQVTKGGATYVNYYLKNSTPCQIGEISWDSAGEGQTQIPANCKAGSRVHATGEVSEGPGATPDVTEYALFWAEVSCE